MIKKIIIASLFLLGGLVYGQDGTIINTGLADSPIFISPVTVGVNDTGYDVKFFGATSGFYWLWDESADGIVQIGTLTVGVDNVGHDVKFFGATAGAYWLWDESADGVVQIATLTIGVDNTGHDVKFFGATASSYFLWNESGDDLELVGAGFTQTPQSLTAATDGGAGSIVLPGVTKVTVVGTGSANDWVLLPSLSSVPIGHQIVMIGNASSNFEVRTPVTSNEKINGTDADADQEMLFIDTEIIVFTKISSTEWYTYGILQSGIADATGNLVD